MVLLKCMNYGCTWVSQDLPETMVQALSQQLEMHAAEAHAAPASMSSSSSTAPPRLKLDPPSISTNSDPDKFASFERQWAMYKVGMAIAPDLVSTALFYCCTEDLRTDLLRDIRGDVARMGETDLMASIRRLSVKEESILVHRIRLGKMVQSPGMGVRSFLAALRGQAALCNYTARCPESGCTHSYDYSEDIIRDHLIRGLADPEILSDLVGDTKTDRSLGETVAFIAQKEQGRATRSVVGDSANAMQGTHTPASFHPSAGKPSCWACGGDIHGQRNDKNARSKHCPAWSFTCAKCSVKGHFSKYCSRCPDCNSWGHRDKSSRFCAQSTRRRPKSGKKPEGTSAKAMTLSEGDPPVYEQLCIGNSEQST